MMKHQLILLATFVSATACTGDVTVAQMDALAKASALRDSSYTTQAIKAFFGDGAAFTKCARPNNLRRDPIVVYLEILPNGKVGRSIFEPLTDTAKCLRAETATRTYPRPTETYVTRIKLSFESR